MDRFLFAIVVLVLLGSCATGKGSGFSREASRERSAHSDDQTGRDTKKKDEQEREQPEQQAPTPHITIQATPPDARITVDGRFFGTGSATLDSEGFGQVVTVKVEAASYRTQTFSMTLRGQTATMSVNLEPILGTLELTGPELGEARLFLSGRTVRPGTNRVPVGNHELRARRFGYSDLNIPLVITENGTVSLSLAFDPAPFAVTSLRATRPRFNPESGPANTTISFEVSGPGEVLLVLTDPNGKERGRWLFHPETWHQQLVWTGRDGSALPDGVYTFTLGTEAATQRVEVVLDRSLADRDWASLGPAPGLLWTPAAEVLSPGTLQIAALALGHAEDGLVHAPVSASVRFSPARGWEVFGQTSFRLWSEADLNSGYATAAVKSLVLASGDFRLAWVLGGTVGSWLEGGAGVPPTDFLTTFPALRALLPASWSWGRWTLLVAPELDGSFWSPASAYQQASGTEGLRFWGYGRVGFSYDAGAFSLGLSGVAKTTSFDLGAGWLAPASLGWEARYPVPQTGVTLSAYLSVSAYSSVDYAWYGGLGCSLLLPEAFTPDMGSSW